MTHYTNTRNPIDFPKKKDIPLLERFAAQSLIEYDGELVFSKEKFAELIVKECAQICLSGKNKENWRCTDSINKGFSDAVLDHFGVEE